MQGLKEGSEFYQSGYPALDPVQILFIGRGKLCVGVYDFVVIRDRTLGIFSY